MAVDIVTFRTQDAEASPKLASFPLRVAAGHSLADLQAYANAVAPVLDALTAAKIVEINVLVSLAIPAGLKANAAALSKNEWGGLVGYTTDGPRASSIWIPAILPTLMPGDSFNTGDALVTALTQIVTNGTVPNNVRTKTPEDHEYLAAVYGKKSVRK